MAVSTDERREIAERLRELAPGSDWPDTVAIACGLNPREMSNDFHDFTGELCDRLADLIEPEERTCRMELHKRGATYDVFYFDCCDEEYSENRTDQYASGISGRVCPYCGAKVTE